MQDFINMRGPREEVAVLNELGNKITQVRFEAIGEAGEFYDPKIVVFVGHKQWSALHGIHYHDLQSCTGNGTTGELQWLGTRVIRTFKDDFVKVIEEKV